MKKYLFHSMAIAMLAMFLTDCASDEEIVMEPLPNNREKTQNGDPNKGDEEDPQNPVNIVRTINLTDAQKAVVSRNNDFAFNFYRQLSSEHAGKSFVISPLSATYALGMLNDGAKGLTSEEITKLLGFGGGSADDINKLCKELIENAPYVDQLATLKLANCIVTDADITVSEQYGKDLVDYYQASVFSKDFSLGSTINFINDWSDNHTEGMIKKIIDKLSPAAQMVMMNAIYFKASWSGKFKKEDTTEEAFTSETSSCERVQMMHRLDGTEYASNDIYATIGLPYGAGEHFKMYVLLPNEGKAVSDVLSTLNENSWNMTLCQLQGELVNVMLPKFKTESDMSLNEVLSSLGATTMFTPQADFTGITAQIEQFFVSLIKQKAAIEVSEEGTEASAVTYTELDTEGEGGGDGVPVIQFRADHPFVYLIQEASSGAIFFIGTYHGD